MLPRRTFLPLACSNPHLQQQTRSHTPAHSLIACLSVVVCSYECPLESLANFYRPPARLLVLIDNMHSNGAQLTQAGLEFNYAGEFLEGRSQLRATGLVAL